MIYLVFYCYCIPLIGFVSSLVDFGRRPKPKRNQSTHEFIYYSNMVTLEIIYNYVASRLRAMGTKVLYTTLLLFYAYQRSDIPGWCKHIITGAIAYLLTPIDAVPDLTPILGYTDDFSVLAFALVNIAGHVNDDIRMKAIHRLESWVGDVHPDDIAEVNRLI